MTIKKELDRFWAKVNKNGPIPSHVPELGQCWLWTGYLDIDGYGRIVIAGANGPEIRAHACALLIENGVRPKLQVLHKCDNPSCVRYDHLFEGTQKQNIADMLSKKRIDRKGVKGHNAKLNDEKIRTIRLMSKSMKEGGYGR